MKKKGKKGNIEEIANVRRSNEYRRYNLLLPEFLHNRLYPFTKHCAEKIELAKAIGEHTIKLLNDDGFTVKSIHVPVIMYSEPSCTYT